MSSVTRPRSVHSRAACLTIRRSPSCRHHRSSLRWTAWPVAASLGRSSWVMASCPAAFLTSWTGHRLRSPRCIPCPSPGPASSEERNVVVASSALAPADTGPLERPSSGRHTVPFRRDQDIAEKWPALAGMVAFGRLTPVERSDKPAHTDRTVTSLPDRPAGIRRSLVNSPEAVRSHRLGNSRSQTASEMGPAGSQRWRSWADCSTEQQSEAGF